MWNLWDAKTKTPRRIIPSKKNVQSARRLHPQIWKLTSQSIKIFVIEVIFCDSPEKLNGLEKVSSPLKKCKF